MQLTVDEQKELAGAAPASPAEQAVRALYDSLSAEQKEAVCFPWDYTEERRGLLRTFISNHWYVTRPFIRSDFYTPPQQELIREIFTQLINPEWEDRFLRALKDDTYGQAWGEEHSVAIFGIPGNGPFQFLMTGRHLTLRTGGGGDNRAAFGGPILYGHAAEGFYTERNDHAGNVFWHQALFANELLDMLSLEQRGRAVLPSLPREEAITFCGQKRAPAGLHATEMSPDQRQKLDELLTILLAPFRREDQLRVRECLRAQGGLERCSLAFYEEGRDPRSNTYPNWRIEGPAFVWYFRGAPHVHVWVHIADTPDVPVNGRTRFVATPHPEGVLRVVSPPGKRVVAITTVKNEIDIVEAFVRHTLALVDHLVILDNGSTDGTSGILRALEREGLSLTIIEDASVGKYLSQRMTHLMRDHAVARHGADWVLPLDADEFLVVPKGRSLIADGTAADMVLSLPWRTYVPHSEDDPAVINPVQRLRHRLRVDHPMVKAMVPRRVAEKPDAVLTQGNHAVEIANEKVPLQPVEGAWLAHFPIRSPGQYLAKIAITALQHHTMGAHAAFGAFHWKAPYELLKRDDKAFAASIFEDARRFSLRPEHPVNTETVIDPLPYLGGAILHTDRVDDNARGWGAVLSYAEDLARRYATLLAGLTPAERSSLEQQINELDQMESATETERLLRLERLELMRQLSEQRARHEAFLNSRTWRVASLLQNPARLALRVYRSARRHLGQLRHRS